jgi:hypothetical protein
MHLSWCDQVWWGQARHLLWAREGREAGEVVRCGHEMGVAEQMTEKRGHSTKKFQRDPELGVGQGQGSTTAGHLGTALGGLGDFDCLWCVQKTQGHSQMMAGPALSGWPRQAVQQLHVEMPRESHDHPFRSPAGAVGPGPACAGCLVDSV